MINNRYSLIKCITKTDTNENSTNTTATHNIQNGVLSCAWNKTSAAPKLLEIYNDSQIKFNIDHDNPLILVFANGWDDKEQLASIVKSLSVTPANIDLSNKLNYCVQIVAKIINDELIITIHDVYDPSWSSWSNIISTFTSGSTGGNVTLNGWTISGSYYPGYHYPYQAFDKNESSY